MANNKSTPVMVRLAPDQVDAIDAWRRLQSDLPSRPEAVRRLAEVGLAADASKARKKMRTS